MKTHYTAEIHEQLIQNEKEQQKNDKFIPFCAMRDVLPVFYFLNRITNHKHWIHLFTRLYLTDDDKCHIF